MIKSITINNRGTKYTVNSTGAPILSGSISMLVDRTADSVAINADTSSLIKTPYYTYFNNIPKTGLPYVNKISGVPSDNYGRVWILGGISSNVYSVGSTLCVSDIAQTVDYPRIYTSVYSMLRQIRLWVDAHKDTIILRDAEANDQWDRMINDTTDWHPIETEDSRTDLSAYYYNESRSRSSIKAIDMATNFLNQYIAIVALWNIAANMSESSSEVRLHPEDSAGLYVGTDVVIRRPSNVTTNVVVELTITRTSGQNDSDLWLWIRSPISKITPSIPGDSTISVSIPGEKVSSSKSSVLDDGYELKAPSLNTPKTVTFKLTIPDTDGSHTMYTFQSVVELIPFYKCGASTFAESMDKDKDSSQGANTWEIRTLVTSNDSTIQDTTVTKQTTYALPCADTEKEE